jgi:Uma2 family endonuclease
LIVNANRDFYDILTLRTNEEPMSQTSPQTPHPNDSAREELINGRLYTSPRPAGPHLIAAYMLGVYLGPPFVLGRGGPGGWWILEEPEVLFYRNRFIPDIVGWRRERLPKIPTDPIIDVVPDWVCEVVSESSRKTDRKLKPPIYLKSGVKHMWIVEPEARTIEVYRATEPGWLLLETFSDDDQMKAEPFEAFAIDLSHVWGEVEAPQQPTEK